MATTKSNLVSIAVSKIVGDEVTSATSDGTLFTSADRLNAINRARGDVYTEMLKTLGQRQFLELYPEFVATASITFASSVANKPVGIRRIIKAYYNSQIIEVAPVEVTLDALYNTYSKWYSTTYPVMVEYSESGVNKLKIIGATISASVTVLYVLDLIDLVGHDNLDTQGGLVPVSFDQTYTKTTKSLYLPAASFGSSHFSTGLTDCSTLIVGAKVIFYLATSGANVWASEIESITDTTHVVLKDDYGGNLAETEFAVAIVFGSGTYADMTEPYSWFNLVIQGAAQYLLNTKQI
jgi:hypothetical protein